MNRIFTLLPAALLALPCLAFSFDGNRRGFVGIFGLGAAPYTYWEQNAPEVDNSDFGYGFGLSVGYGWDNRNTILFNINGFAYNTELFQKDYTFVQGLYSAQWNHYFSETYGSLFTTLGIGIRFFGITVEDDDRDISNGNRGFGYEAGIGYQFHKYLQAKICYSGGKTGCYDTDYRHHLVYALVELIGY